MNKKNKIIIYFKAIRIHHWIKNILVFLPMLAAQEFTRTNFINGAYAFLVFSLIASSVYIVNDLIDLKSDKLNPSKSKRVFSSELISIFDGIKMSIYFFLIGIVVSYYFINFFFTFHILLYYILTLIYSLYLKKIIIIDIFVLAIFYLMRIISGAVATDIKISFWLLAFAFFIFLSLASIKRISELIDSKKENKKKIIGRNYFIDDLPILSMIATSSGFVSIIVIAFYINSQQALNLYENPFFLWGICIIITIWISRLILLANRGKIDNDPIMFAIKDKISYIALIIILFFLLLASYKLSFNVIL